MKKVLLFLICLITLTFSCHLDRLADLGENCPNKPIATFSIQGGGSSCEAPCTVTFINSSSNATSYTLQFGDGGTADFSSGNVTHTYTSAGVYTASLTAYGDGECPDDSKNVTLTVTSVACPNPPTAVFSIEGGGANCLAPCTVNFINSSTNATGYRIIFGDGDTTDFTTGNITHTYTNAGLYSVSMIAFGATNCPNNTAPTQQITVLPSGSAPTAGFKFDLSDNSGKNPCNVAFTNETINGMIYSWDFGDNSPISNDVSPSHIYECQGDYVVKLTATNDFGSNSISKNVKINALTFNENYDQGTAGYCVRPTNDGGFIVVGNRTNTSQGTSSLLFIKYNDKGELIWENTYLYNSTFNGINSTAISVLPLSVDRFILNISTNENVHLVEYGNGVVWNTSFDMQVSGPESLTPTNDGGFVLVGSKNDLNNKSSIYLVKVDALGQIVDEATFTGSGDQRGISIKQTTDQGFIITGEISDQNGGSNAFLLKTDLGLNQQWMLQYPGLGISFGASVETTADGGYVVGGSSATSETENSKIFLFKVNNLGMISFQNYFEGGGEGLSSFATSVLETDDGGFILSAFGSNVHLLKTNSQGGLLFSKPSIIGSTSKLVTSWNIQKAISCGNFILTGAIIDINSGNNNMFIQKIDEDGN